RPVSSARQHEQIIYGPALATVAGQHGRKVAYTLTRAQPPGWKGYARRIDDAMLAEVTKPLGPNLVAYVCGPTALVEAAADGLERIGLPADRIRTERFGPSGT